MAFHHAPFGILLFLLAFGVLFASPSFAASPETARKVAEGNAALEAGDFDAALTAYEEAEVTCPECPELAYDRGLVHYRQRDFAKAREQFNAALATRDLSLEARAKYNLGVVSYAEALEKLNAPKESIELARQAIYHYRDALELQPEDPDARANIETAQLLIKDLLDKLKNEQEQDQQNQDQQNQQQQQEQQQQDQEQQQQDQESSEDQQQQQEQQQSGENEDEPQDEQSSEEQQQSQQEQEQQQENQQQSQEDQSQQQSGEQNQQADQQEAQAKPGEQRKMTEEELERALQAVRDREAQRREERARRRNARRVPVTRDW